jgi:N6-adenosine-specific RNA methylase IME4
MTFVGLPRNHYGAILADPPWRFRTWDNREAIKRIGNGTNVSAATHYDTMDVAAIRALPLRELAATDCSLFLWVTWPNLLDGLSVLDAWGFTYKTCAFAWTKAHAGQLEMFEETISDQMGLGYWTRANTETCLLATRGKPKRLNADVRQAIIEPRRQHSRKPDCVHGRIERLVAGPYLELFARQQRSGWDCWGNETDKFRSESARPGFSEIWDAPFYAEQS